MLHVVAALDIDPKSSLFSYATIIDVQDPAKDDRGNGTVRTKRDEADADLELVEAIDFGEENGKGSCDVVECCVHYTAEN